MRNKEKEKLCLACFPLEDMPHFQNHGTCVECGKQAELFRLFDYSDLEMLFESLGESARDATEAETPSASRS